MTPHLTAARTPKTPHVLAPVVDVEELVTLTAATSTLVLTKQRDAITESGPVQVAPGAAASLTATPAPASSHAQKQIEQSNPLASPISKAQSTMTAKTPSTPLVSKTGAGKQQARTPGSAVKNPPYKFREAVQKVRLDYCDHTMRAPDVCLYKSDY